MFSRIAKLFRLKLTFLHGYILRQFFVNFLLCLLTSTSLFLVFDLFERLGLLIREGASIGQATSYMLLKIPLMLQLMTPISALIATLLTIGRLSQLSEITAMRACGVSIIWLSQPLLITGLMLSIASFLLGETVVPWATRHGEEIYHLDIRKKASTGRYSKSNFWYRAESEFLNVDFYDSREQQLNGFSLYQMGDDFRLKRLLDSTSTKWQGKNVGWVMDEVTEIAFDPDGRQRRASYKQLPLVIPAKPKDFYDTKLNPETMNTRALSRYIVKLKDEGVPTTEYEVSYYSKFSFPLVSFIGILVSIPFSLRAARSGTMTSSFIAGVSLGFAYHCVHAVCSSLGSGELIPALPAAWSANIILGCIGGYLLAGSENT